jgi:hypothetical protein
MAAFSCESYSRYGLKGWWFYLLAPTGLTAEIPYQPLASERRCSKPHGVTWILRDVMAGSYQCLPLSISVGFICKTEIVHVLACSRIYPTETLAD